VLAVVIFGLVGCVVNRRAEKYRCGCKIMAVAGQPLVDKQVFLRHQEVMKTRDPRATDLRDFYSCNL